VWVSETLLASGNSGEALELGEAALAVLRPSDPAKTA
jgi:hypothetical protein